MDNDNRFIKKLILLVLIILLFCWLSETEKPYQKEIKCKCCQKENKK
jgi:hypothetical protein